MNEPGFVVSLHIAPVGAAPMQSVRSVNVIAGRGLEGDRYFNGAGTYSGHPGTGRHVTLIESEAIAALRREYSVEIEPGYTRRNIVTRGAALNHLVEKEFAIGTVILFGTRLCEPCSHVEKLTVKGALRGLVHRGGLRAEIVTGGMIRLGDEIVPVR